MTTIEHEKFSRLILITFDGGTKVSKALFGKCFKEQTPDGYEPSPWTIDQFLDANKHKILGSQTGRAKERIYFPGATGTNMEEWDLFMFCFVLIDVCAVTRTVRLDVEQLRKIRNKLCHMKAPKVTNDEYERYLDKIEVAFGRLLAVIDDKNLTQEIDVILLEAKERPLSFGDTLDVMHKFYSMEGDVRETMSDVSKDVKEMMEKIKELERKQDMYFKDRSPNATDNVKLPDAFIELLVKNCVADKEVLLSKLLVSMYKEVTGKSTGGTGEMSDESRNTLMKAVLETVKQFASKGRSIEDAEQKCVILRIRCSSVSSLLSLFYDCIEGDLNNEFSKLETAVRQMKGFEEVFIVAVVYKDEFWKAMNKTVSALDEAISRTYNIVYPETENTEAHDITGVHLVERLSPTSDDENRIQHAVRLTIKTDLKGQEQLKNSIRAGSFDSSINRLREELVEQYDLKNLSIVPRFLENGSEQNAGTRFKSEHVNKDRKRNKTRKKHQNRFTEDDKELAHLSLEKYLVGKRSPAKPLAQEINPQYSYESKSKTQTKATLHESAEAAGHLPSIGKDTAYDRPYTRRASFGSISTARDSGIYSDRTDMSSASDAFSYQGYSDSLSIKDVDDFPSDERHMDYDMEPDKETCVIQLPLSCQDVEQDDRLMSSNTVNDELLMKQGIKLNQSYLAQIKGKSSKSKTCYQGFMTSSQLKDKLRTNPNKYIPCILHLEQSHEAYGIPTIAYENIHRIEISGRSKIGQAYNEDEVVVEILDSKHKSEKRFGQVIGVLKRQRCKDLKHPVFLCTPDDTASHIVRPICKTVPKINILQDEIRSNTKQRRGMLFKIHIYEYDEHAELLHNPRTETLSRADMQHCIFLVAVICWEPNQLYPKGAILKRFPCGENISSGLKILNLRYDITQNFSKRSEEEMELISDRVNEKDSNFESDLNDDTIQDMSDLRTFTIDRHDLKDLNYAFSIQVVDDYYKVGVHISDVALYVTKGSPIDEDAFKRAMTIYTETDTPRYMLPEQIALELCSLKENEKRPVISVYLYLNEEGWPVQTSGLNFLIEKSFIRCFKNISYRDAQKMIEGNTNKDALTCDLKQIFRLISKERRNRLGNAIYTLSSHEIEMEGSLNGCMEAHFLAEELVILANRKVSDVLSKRKISLPLLVQLPPSKKNLEDFHKKYDGYIGILTHFQSQKPGVFPNETLDCVLQSNSKKRLMVTEPVWNSIKASFESPIEYILNDNIHPIQCVIYQDWMSIQGKPFYMCSNADKKNQVLQNKYVQCTAPTRRYADLIVQRLIHCYIAKQRSMYGPSDIDTVCSHVSHVLRNVISYQYDCTGLRNATQLKTRPEIKSCFVRAVSDKSISVVYPSTVYTRYQDIEIPFKLLDMGYKPEVCENRNTELQQVKGQWRKRFYDRNAKPLIKSQKGTNEPENSFENRSGQEQFIQTLNHNRELLFIKLPDWARLVRSAVDKRVKDLRHSIFRTSAMTDDRGENEISTECSEINSYTIFSYIFQTGQPLKIQMSAEPKQGIIAPKPVLYELTESITLCLQHVDDPVLHLSKYAVRSALDQYKTCLEYRETWLPIVSMEAAVAATSNEESFYIKNVNVEIINETRGRFVLPVRFCLKRNIGFSGVFSEDTETFDEDDTRLSFDWLCIRNNLSETQMNETMLKRDDYYWIGHAEVKEVLKTRKSKHQPTIQTYIVTFDLHVRCGAFPEAMQNQGNVKCHIEVMRKTDVDRRIESQLKSFPGKGHRLAVQIALKGNQKDLDSERILLANSIYRDLHITVPAEDLRKRLLPKNNHLQQKAIDVALSSQFTLIQGPPGTGKTYTGIKLIHLFNEVNKKSYKQLVKTKKQVLFCGPSNKSVDLVGKWMIHRLGDLCPDFIRVYGKATESLDYPIPGISYVSKGSSIHRADRELKGFSLHHLIRSKENVYAETIKDMEDRFNKENRRPEPEHFQEYLDVLRTATNAEIRKHDIILCTTGVASNPKTLRGTGIYQIIIDEAGMCSEPQCMVPLLATKAEQVVLIGDHKQLRPIVRCTAAAELGLEKSLFERYATTINNPAKYIMLQDQYRMNPSLCEFPSLAFYDGKLRTKLGPWQYETLDIWPTDAYKMEQYTHVLIHVEGEENVLTVSTDEGNEQSKSNDLEIETVVQVYRYLIEEHICSSAINIISQYNAQCAEIREKLRKEGFTNYIVNTVVSSQGGEWDYVIFSTVRSLPDYKIEPNPTLGWCKHNLGFITDKNQINVALTRAKKGLVIVGNKNLLNCDAVWKRLISHYEQRHCIKLPGQFPPPPRTRQQRLKDAQNQNRLRFGDHSESRQSGDTIYSRTNTPTKHNQTSFSPHMSNRQRKTQTARSRYKPQ